MTGLHGRRGDERSPGDAETLEVGSWRGEEVGLSASDYRRDLTASASAWPTVAAILEHSSLLVTIRLYLHLHDSAAQVAVEVLAICRGGRGWRPFVCCQDFYNLLYRDIGKRMLPFLQKYGLGLIPPRWTMAGILMAYRRRTAASGLSHQPRLHQACHTSPGHSANRLDG